VRNPNRQEAQVTRSLGVAGAAASAIALLAGCGSSSSSTTGSTSAATAASTPTQSTAAATTAAAPGVTVRAKQGKLGPILAAGPKRLTVYLFEADKGAASACTGACSKVWPPVTTRGAPVAAAGATSADLGTVARADGTKQVTYKGHPLYFFAKDGDAGDAYGEGSNAFGAGWYVLRPNGSKVDNS
jgi:predicted lipoprotein with Yx(FWY)xxD motif